MGRDLITIEEPDGAAHAECGSCDWSGPASQLDAPDGAILTPGDPCPAGRCPECGALAYLEEPATPATEAETVVAAAAEGGDERWGAAIANEVERQIAECLVRDALALGYRVTVNDGGETTLRDSSHLTAVGAALATTAWDWLSFRDTAGTVVGCVHLIWGNGAAVISDHTANDALDAILAGANALADRFGA